jgi:PAS domain S-box-containing protein
LNAKLEQRVTERTAELGAERGFSDTVLQTTGALVVVLDGDGRIVRFNRACELVTGYHVDDVRGASVFDTFVAPDEADAVRGVFHRLLHEKSSLSHENYWRTRSGNRRLIAWSNSTIQDAAGAVQYVIATGIDVTERKRAERELIRAKEEAEAANRAKSEFLARMSHELRTPMNAILGFSQLLRDEPLSEEQLGYVNDVITGGEHLLKLINALLDLGRVEAGRIGIAIEAVNAHLLTADAVQVTQPQAAAKEIRIETNLTAIDGRRALADAARLKQILLSLLSNAVKFNSRGGHVLVHGEAVAPDRIRLAVTDTGPGIPVDRQASLFTPFARASRTMRENEGAGIGLALAQKLAHLMGATLGMQSTAGSGSTFWIELPSLRVEADDDDQPRDAGVRRTKVLYIEDNPSNVRVMEQIFARRNDTLLLTAPTGELGLELARAHRPQAILLDIHLPGMDGFEVVEHLRASELTRDIPVIAVSADAMPLEVQRGLDAGLFAYLTKPVNMQELNACVARALGAGDAAR